MKSSHRRLSGAIAASALSAAVLVTPALAQPVTGRMTIHGKPVELKHAVAQPYSRAGGPPAAYAVALTDRPLPEGALDGPEAAGIRLLAYEKKVRGLLLLIDPADPAAATAVPLDEFGSKGLKASIIKVGEPDRQELTNLRIDAKRIVAKAVRNWPIDEVRFDLALDVPLRPGPATTADAQGRDATRASPVWKAATAQVARMEKATVKSAKALNAGFGPMTRVQNEVALQHFFDEKFFAELNRKRALELRDILDKSTRVIERGRWATIVPADPSDKPLELVQDASGTWLLWM